MAITATMVNELRQKAGVGLMDCKKALVATNGDMDAAMEYLRKAGIAKADKKAGRSASEGVVETLIEGKTGVAVEILCETDFVARTDAFKDFCNYVARTAMAMDGDGDISEKLAAATEEEMKVLIGKLGENMHVRRAVRWTTNGIIKEYKHHQGGPFYGVMVDLEGEYTDELAMDVCLHITANAPSYVTSKDVPEAVIAKEREIAAALPELQGKPEKILDGILRGKINKFFTTACLMDQPWINDEKTTLAKVAPKLVVKRFIRWQVGEEVK